MAAKETEHRGRWYLVVKGHEPGDFTQKDLRHIARCISKGQQEGELPLPKVKSSNVKVTVHALFTGERDFKYVTSVCHRYGAGDKSHLLFATPQNGWEINCLHCLTTIAKYKKRGWKLDYLKGGSEHE